MNDRELVGVCWCAVNRDGLWPWRLVRVLLDSPATLLTTRAASCLMTKTEGSLCRVCVSKLAKQSAAVHLCDVGSPKACTAETSAGVRAWTDSKKKIKAKKFTKSHNELVHFKSKSGSDCEAVLQFFLHCLASCWGYLREMQTRWTESACTWLTCIFLLMLRATVFFHCCLQLNDKA